MRNDQNIEVHAGQRMPLTVTLEPSPDTGFELTSEPPGGLVWLDGAAIKGAAGQQARTDFRAYRIAPGHHVLEIKGENRFKPWRQDIEVEPGAIAEGSRHAGSGVGRRRRESPRRVRRWPPPPPAPAAPAARGQADAAQPAAAAGTRGGGRAPGSPAAAGRAARAPPQEGARGGARRRRRRFAEQRRRQRAAAKAADKGGDCTMTISSVPWSEVWIDGKNTSKHTPFADYKIPCGKHKMAFKRTDLQIDQTESINVKPGQKFKQRYTLATDE